MTDRRLELMPLGALQPNPRNPRQHKLAQLRGSFTRFGYTNPISLDERTGLISTGHGRRQLLAEMRQAGAPAPEGVEVRGDDWYVPVTRGWASADDDEAFAALVADNRQTELGGWDTPELAEVLTELAEFPQGLTGVGFTPRDLVGLLEPADQPASQVENSYDQRADNYRNKQVRSIVFDYPVADYEFVTQAAAEARKAFGVETTAELFVAMLQEWEKGDPVD